MKNIMVHILNEKLDTVKTFVGFSGLSFAVDFAKHETGWRGVPAMVAWEDDAGNVWERLFE